MASGKEVKNRIKSVKNIAQITRALEAVSASRVRRAQERVMASRAYSEKAWEILLNLQSATRGAATHPLLTQRADVNRVLIVLVTSDRGLAGAFNSNIIRVANTLEARVGKPVSYITVGRKGRDSLIRVGKDVIAEFSDLPANPTISDIAPISQLAVDSFLSGEFDEVLIAYTDFVNMLTQRPVVLTWLPLSPGGEAEQVAQEYVKDVPDVSDGAQDYEYEPNAAGVLDEIVPRFTELQLFQAVLESQASEHAARMTAMRNATDNANQLVTDLTLEYNKARQAAITNEILDIVGGANALEATLKQKAKQRIADTAVNTPRAARRQEVMEPTPDANPTDNRIGEVVTGGSDDLTRIEGIGKKMAGALNDAGIRTYSDLSKTDEQTIRNAIEAAGMRFAPSLGTWAEQAGYAAKGDWQGLTDLQDRLKAGRDE